ncbi:MAG: DUF445 family protein [Deltaproteobacteria bacterium]|nr:DUF445 family protein [Deltaproteobacteria bacterium]
MSDTMIVLVTVPLVAAFVGWLTNWQALVMIFRPLKFRGIGPIGWQGILPRKALKFADDVGRMLTERLISPRELALRLDPTEMEQLLASTLDAETLALTREAAELIRPGAWAALPEPLRDAIVAQVRAQTSQAARELFDKLQGISSELLDVRALVTRELTGANTGRLVMMFKRLGHKELQFIEYSGGVFGFLIGLLQAASWGLFGIWWTMPLVGVIVGLATNWLALKMVFRPQQPTRYLGLVTYQGVFARRQAEIARDYGRIAAEQILTPRNLIRLITEGAGGERLARLISETVAERLDTEWKKVEPLVPVRVEPEVLTRIKQLAAQRIVARIPDVTPELESYIARKLEVARTIEDKLAALSKPEFERVLRGLFEEDELLLIIIGGALGGAVGLVQGLLAMG